MALALGARITAVRICHRRPRFLLTIMIVNYIIQTRKFYSPVAQLVEQRTVNPWVGGSWPPWGAKIQEHWPTG